MPGVTEPWTQQLDALRGPLARYFRRKIEDPAEVDDLVQDTFMRVIQRGDLGRLEYFTGYVFQAAESVLKDRGRRRRRRQSDRHVPFEADRHGGVAPSPENQLGARETIRATSLVLMELAEVTRAVFVLRRLEGQSFAEISRRLGIPLSTAEKHMQKAVRKLWAAREEPW
jgi:RNA polymerase sigma factor (sigma-70 family)